MEITRSVRTQYPVSPETRCDRPPIHTNYPLRGSGVATPRTSQHHLIGPLPRPTRTTIELPVECSWLSTKARRYLREGYRLSRGLPSGQGRPSAETTILLGGELLVCRSDTDGQPFTGNTVSAPSTYGLFLLYTNSLPALQTRFPFHRGPTPLRRRYFTGNPVSNSAPITHSRPNR